MRIPQKKKIVFGVVNLQPSDSRMVDETFGDDGLGL